VEDGGGEERGGGGDGPWGCTTLSASEQPAEGVHDTTSQPGSLLSPSSAATAAAARQTCVQERSARRTTLAKRSRTATETETLWPASALTVLLPTAVKDAGAAAVGNTVTFTAPPIRTCPHTAMQ